MNIAQRLQDKGEKIGWEKGREEERLLAHQRQLDMARNLMVRRLNVTFAFIS